MENFMYSYGIDRELMEFLTEFGFALIGVLAVLALVVMAAGIALYVLNSIGLYTIAKRRGIHHAWLAWVPVANYWVLGCVSDQYQYVVKGKVKNKRLLLLLAGIAGTLISGAVPVINISNQNIGAVPAMVGGLLLGVLGLLSLCISIITLVFYYMALYDLYTSCVPANNVPYLVFSILFRVTEPFFVFFSRNKDGGMPPKREVPPVFVEEETADGPELL